MACVRIMTQKEYDLKLGSSGLSAHRLKRRESFNQTSLKQKKHTCDEYISLFEKVARIENIACKTGVLQN